MVPIEARGFINQGSGLVLITTVSAVIIIAAICIATSALLLLCRRNLLCNFTVCR